MHPATSLSPDQNFPHPPVLPPQSAYLCSPATLRSASPMLDSYREGIIDTVILRIQVPLKKPDRERLMTGPEWGRIETKRSGSGGAEFGAMTCYLRESDGVRVKAMSTFTLVEASLPRVLGLGNHEQHLMTWADTLRAISMITEKLLPWTTAVARLHSEDDRELDWAITRLDLARNFRGSVAEVVAAYSEVRWCRCRRSASRITRKRNVKQLLWTGKYRQLSIYDKGEEMRAGKRRDCYRSPPARDKVGRAELRYIGTVAMARLVADASEYGASETQLLPLLVKCGPREAVRMMIPIDAAVLHALLHAELRTLGAARETPPCCRTVAQFGLLKLAEDAAAWEAYQIRNSGKRVVGTTRAKVAALRAERSVCNLSELCYHEMGSCAAVTYG